MNNDLEGKKGCFGLCLLLIGAMIGAGFITGAEIWQFFARFGYSSIFGVLIFAVLSYLLVLYETKSRINFSRNSKRFNKVKENINFFNELMVASAMISGLKIVTKQLFNNNYIVVFFLVVIVIFIILLFGLKMFSFYNYFIVGFVAFVCVSLMLLNKNHNLILDCNLSLINTLFSCGYGALYIFMNFSTIKPIIAAYDINFNNKTSKRTSIIFTILMSFLILFFTLFLQNNLQFSNKEMPILEFFALRSNNLKFIFSIGVICSMISTCLACLIGVKGRVNKKSHDNLFSSLVSMIAVLIFSFIPFSFFVSVVYLFIGFLNLILFFVELLTH